MRKADCSTEPLHRFTEPIDFVFISFLGKDILVINGYRQVVSKNVDANLFFFYNWKRCGGNLFLTCVPYIHIEGGIGKGLFKKFINLLQKALYMRFLHKMIHRFNKILKRTSFFRILRLFRHN